MDSQAPHNKSQTLPAKDAVGKQSPTLSAKHAGNSSAVTSTAALDKESLSTRRNLYGAIICGSCGSLVFGFICALKYAQAKKSAPKAGAANKVNAEDGSKQQSFWGGGAGYEYQQLEEAAQEVQEGLGALSPEEIEDMLEQLSPEEREARLNAWALARAEKLRSDNAGFYVLRKTILVVLMILYVAGSVGIPALHRGEASCSQGFFWETHMQFLAIVLVTKLAELALMAGDDMVAWDKVHVVDMLIKFLPSFLGFLDGYTDANAIVIAAACDHPLAQVLAWAMGISYVVGVLLLQWGVMFVLACQDPSHACLLKLLHMDMLATCVTLPTEQKWVWDMLAIVRTVGEDMPQAVLQTIYLVKVKKNFFMLLSVMMAVSASLKALYDARARALAAAGAGEEYDNRERDYIIYSCSQDGTIKSWNIKEGCCVKTIVADSPANTVAATRGMLYSSHDVGEMLEWSLETGDRSRTFQHTGANGELVATVDFLFTWAVEDDTLEMDETAKTTYKMWSLDSGDCIREFMGPRTDEVRLFVKGDNFFATAPEDDSAVAHWNIHSGERLGTFVGHGARINAIFATHKRLVTGSSELKTEMSL